MSMNDRLAGEPLLFALLDKTPQTDLKIVCQAPSEDVKDNWTSQLRSILDMQGDFLRGQSKEVIYFMLERAQPAQATAGIVAGGRPSYHSNCSRVARSV